MATPAQALANTQNAQHSTGPKTEAGKTTVAQNAVTHGLFTSYERLLPEAAGQVNQFIAELQRHIPNPSVVKQQIIRDYAVAIWRNELHLKLEQSFFHAAIAQELTHPESAALVEKFGRDVLWGLAVTRDASGPNVLNKILRYQSRIKKDLSLAAEAYSQILTQARAQAAKAQFAPQKTNPIPKPQPQPEAPQSTQTPRNALCPCGSGIKFKRCCGEHAPALINAA